MPAMTDDERRLCVEQITRADATLASEISENLVALQQLAPRVIEAMRRIWDHGERLKAAYESTLTPHDLLTVGAPCWKLFDELPAVEQLGRAWGLADVIADAHPNNPDVQRPQPQ